MSNPLKIFSDLITQILTGCKQETKDQTLSHPTTICLFQFGSLEESSFFQSFERVKLSENLSTMINFQQKDYSSLVLKTIKDSGHGQDDPLAIVGSEGMSSEVSNLWMYSPLVRSILNTLSKVEQHLIILPGFSSEDIRSGLDMLHKSDNEPLYFNERTKCFLETLGVDMRNSEVVEKIKFELVVGKSDEQRDLEDVKCIFCERRFVGSRSKLKDKLKCHIGNIHFSQEMQKEISIFFDDRNNCLKCGKFYHRGNMKRKHLTFNHSYLVERIMEEVYKSLDRENSGRHPTDTEALLKSDHESSGDGRNDIKMETVEDDNDDIEDLQSQLLLINDLSDSEEEEYNESTNGHLDDLKVTESQVIVMAQDFSSDEENEDLEKDEKQNENNDISFSSDEDDNDKNEAFKGNSSHEGNGKLVVGTCFISDDLNNEIEKKVDEMIEPRDRSRQVWRCKMCWQTDTKQSRLRRHAEDHLNYSLPCPFCPTQCQSRSSLREHFRVTHKDKNTKN